MGKTTTWRQKLNYELTEREDSLVAIAPDESVLDIQFYDGFGHSQGPSFTAWSETRVYFPVVYDGSEWVESVPRHPCDEATSHIGGE